MDTHHTPLDCDSDLTLAINSNDLLRACLTDLGALLRALRQASAAGTDAHHLAGLGAYLADDWLALADQEARHLAARAASAGQPTGEPHDRHPDHPDHRRGDQKARRQPRRPPAV